MREKLHHEELIWTARRHIPTGMAIYLFSLTTLSRKLILKLIYCRDFREIAQK